MATVKYYRDMQDVLMGKTPKVKRIKMSDAPGNKMQVAARVIEKLTNAWERKEAEKSSAADRAMAIEMAKDYNAPGVFNPAFDGTSSEDLLEGMNNLDTYKDSLPSENPNISPKDSYNWQGDQTDLPDDFGIGNAQLVLNQDADVAKEAPAKNVGMTRIDRNIGSGVYNLPNQSLFGSDNGEMGPSTQAMQLALLGQERGREDAATASKRAMEEFRQKQRIKSARALALKKQGDASGYSSRPASPIQIHNRQNQLRDDRKIAFKNKDSERVAEIDREIKRLDVIIAHSPEYKGAIAAATKSGTGIGEKTTKRYYQAREAKHIIADIDVLTTKLRAVDGSTIGFMSDINKLKNKVVASLGGKEAAKKVSDVEIIKVLMGAEVFPLIQSLGLGARGMDTPAEREFMLEVLTGSTTLTVETLLAMAAKRRAAQVRSVNDWNKQLKSGELDSFYKTNNLINRPFAVPSGALDGNGRGRPPLSSFEGK